jgi:hypothetical protein
VIISDDLLSAFVMGVDPDQTGQPTKEHPFYGNGDQRYEHLKKIVT